MLLTLQPRSFWSRSSLESAFGDVSASKARSSGLRFGLLYSCSLSGCYSLLLAGTDPIDAVILQLVVMFLVLGSVATSVVVMTRFVAAKALTVDLRVAGWVTAPPEKQSPTAS